MKWILPNHPISIRKHRRVSGFTLTEVLVVLLIIAVLASLLLVVISKMRRSASSAVCVTKMRQIGSVLVAYAQEHNGRLPTSAKYGTLFVGQGPWYNRDDRRLQNHIGEYIGAEESTTWSTQGTKMTFHPAFAWPAHIANGKPGASSVLLNTSVKYLDAGTVSNLSPWSGVKPNGGAYVGRMVDNIENPARARVFIEVDQQNTNAGWKNLVPAEPIHGEYRNCLFFDWHVEPVPTKF
jgi:prepilin-type N-terminal cleavage/methylation domain-containing protein/prepilin-type processing-associated H-X9-DG protein